MLFHVKSLSYTRLVILTLVYYICVYNNEYAISCHTSFIILTLVSFKYPHTNVCRSFKYPHTNECRSFKYPHTNVCC